MKDKINLNHYYIFVNLNADAMSLPDFFICTGKEAFEKCKQYKTRGIVDLSTVKGEEFKGRWDKLVIDNLK